MHKLTVSTIFAVLITAGLALGANEAWKTKPYQQWDKNDIKEVLTDSPWIKHTIVTASWKKGFLNTPENTQGSQSPQPRQGSMGGGYPGGGAQSSGAQSTNPQEPSMDGEGAGVAFYVRWSSAQVVREAVARDAVLNGHSSEAQATQYVDQAPSEYQVMMYSADMTPFNDKTEDTLRTKAYLEVKPSKEKVNPSKVEIVKDTDGKKVVSVVFSFPKQDPKGQPLFAADAKQAQFDCKLKDLHVSTDFDLRKMVGKNGQDF